MMCTRETERYTLVTKQTQSKSQPKTLKTQSNYFDWNNQGKLFNSLNRCKYDDMKSRCNNISFMCVKIPMDQTYLSKQNQGGNKYVRKLQPKFHVRSYVAVLLTQQLLSEQTP
ncbi:Hypothetical_protein [Hexamita inflata]|uniref:Hypothetical_protein n=1 Tax=Hexamita inflata TaxID=28002 RepID=A0AA86UMA4_9EUKA|nr:Hypothetical protein HINF_LOCUS44594 [Hexamita inflata]CAI9956952.1 Hypothetical protein HINF_LOCUS44597 [Hexamita inflata]